MILLLSVPSAPVVSIRGSTSTSIFLSWSSQQNDFIKGFNITATYTGPCNTRDSYTRRSLHFSKREFNITGLQEYSNYSIVVSAFNDAGSNFSQIQHITTNSSCKSE